MRIFYKAKNVSKEISSHSLYGFIFKASNNLLTLKLLFYFKILNFCFNTFNKIPY